MSTSTDREAARRPENTRERSAGIRDLVSRVRPRLGERTSRPELWAESIVAAAFLAAAVPLAILSPHYGSPSVAVIVLFVVLYGVISRIEFDVGTGYGPPTQLVLVPMLYALPPGTVPLLVAAGMVAGKLPSFVRGSRHPDRAIPGVADGVVRDRAGDRLRSRRIAHPQLVGLAAAADRAGRSASLRLSCHCRPGMAPRPQGPELEAAAGPRLPPRSLSQPDWPCHRLRRRLPSRRRDGQPPPERAAAGLRARSPGAHANGRRAEPGVSRDRAPAGRRGRGRRRLYRPPQP